MTDPDPPDIAHWGLHCFCLGARRTPHRAVAADNNGRILYLARKGVTQDALAAAGVACTDSQLALLQMMGLLCVSGDVLHTAFPVLGSATMRVLRGTSMRHAGSIAGSLVPATRRVGDLLAANQTQAHQYAVVFGHGLDSLLWDILRRQDGLPSTGLSVHKPFWNGLFWAIYPKRDGVAGTNQANHGVEALVTVWTERSASKLRAIASRWERGEWREPVPIVHVGPDDPLNAACEEIALRAADALRSLVDELHAQSVAGLTREQLLLIAGHEFIWDLAEHLCKSGHLIDPAALHDEAATEAQARALTYIRSDNRR